MSETISPETVEEILSHLATVRAFFYGSDDGDDPTEDQVLNALTEATDILGEYR